MSNKFVEIAIKVKDMTKTALSNIKQGMAGVAKATDNAGTSTDEFNKKLINLNQRVQVYAQVSAAVSQLAQGMADLSNMYAVQEGAEVRLATVMRQRMKSTKEDISSIYELTRAQQQLGIIGDEVQLSGAQQLATFLDQKESLNALIPAMNNLLAQQKGVAASAGDAVNVGNLMGKVMQGQTSALTRVGITFTEAEQKVLKYGNEQERAAQLAQVIVNNVGEMNAALAATDSGQAQQVANTFSDIKEMIGELTAGISPYMTIVASGVAFLAQLSQIGMALSMTRVGVMAASAATKVYTVVQYALNAAMTANPIGVVVVALAALAAGIAYAYKKSDWFREKLDLAWEAIKNFGNGIKDNVLGRIRDWIGGMGKLGQSISLLMKGKFKESWTAAKEGVQQLGNAYNPFKSYVDGDTKAVNNLSDAAKGAASAVGTLNKKTATKDRQMSLSQLDAEIKAQKKLRDAAEDRTEAKKYQDEIVLLEKKKKALEKYLGLNKSDVEVKVKAQKGSVKALEAEIAQLRTKQENLPFEKAIKLTPKIKELQAKLDRQQFFLKIGYKWKTIKMPKLTVPVNLEGANKIKLDPITLPELPETPYKKYQKDLDAVTKANKETTETFGALGGAMGDIGNAIGGVAGNWLQYGANVMQALGMAIPAIMTMIGVQTADTVSKNVNTNATMVNTGAKVMNAHAGIPFVGVALGIAGLASIIGAMASIPKYAKGGIAYGPTVGMFGEYAGAANNPEVVAPLSKLREMIADTGGGGGGTVTFKIAGRHLVGLLNKESRHSSKTT